MDTLKPCPFCGGEAMLAGPHSSNSWWCVRCDRCRFDGPYDMGKSGAIEQWNTRPGEDAHHTLLGDALFALENAGSAPDLCERIRAAIRDGDNPNIERGIDGGLFGEMGY